MARLPMIPAQPADDGTPFKLFHDFAKKLLAVPKGEIDARDKKPAHPKKSKST